MHFLRKREDLGLEEFFSRWSAAHAQVMETSPTAAATLRGFTQSRQVPEANAMLAYFGAEETRHYEGVGSLWFDNDSSVGLFRHYEKALLALNAESNRSFYVPAESFFVYAHEIKVL